MWGGMKLARNKHPKQGMCHNATKTRIKDVRAKIF